MTQRPLLATLAVAGYTFSMMTFITIPGTVNAQTALSGCDPTTGLGRNGQPCVELTPLDPNRISNVSFDADGSSQFRPLDTSTLGQTYQCRQLNGGGQGTGGAALLIEDCGTPLTSAELGELKPFYGTTATPAPAPAPAPAPVVYTPPPVVVAAPVPPPLPPLAVPPVTAPVAIASSGLGSAGLIAAGVGAAAVIGIAAIALSDDDDDDNTVNTPSTPGT